MVLPRKLVHRIHDHSPEDADMRLKDKVAIVTGGAHGMGEAEARLFAAEGVKVIVADILENDAEIIAANIRAGGDEATAAKIDVTSEAEWFELIAKAVATYGRAGYLGKQRRHIGQLGWRS